MLRRGLGRAVLYLEQNDATPYRDLILEACRRNLAYDRVCEDNRARYLFDIIHATGEPGWYADRIRAAVLNSTEEDYFDQLADLAGLLARNGDEAARDALYTAFARRVYEGDPTGAGAIIRLDGGDGYRFVAEHLAAVTLPEEELWWHQHLMDELGGQVGEPLLPLTVEMIRTVHPGLTEYLSRTLCEWHAGKADTRHRRRDPRPDYETIRAAIEDTSVSVSRPHMSRWGREADEATLERLAHDLLAATDKPVIVRYLWLFDQRAFPLVYGPLLRLAVDDDRKVAWRAIFALANLTHPDMRAFGLELLATTDRLREGIMLLIKNPSPDDHLRIDDALSRPLDDDQIHGITIAVRDYFEENHPQLPDEAAVSLVYLYERGPCPLCRCGVLDLLMEFGRLPDWIRREAIYDCYDGVRELVTEDLALETAATAR